MKLFGGKSGRNWWATRSSEMSFAIYSLLLLPSFAHSSAKLRSSASVKTIVVRRVLPSGRIFSFELRCPLTSLGAPPRFLECRTSIDYLSSSSGLGTLRAIPKLQNVKMLKGTRTLLWKLFTQSIHLLHLKTQAAKYNTQACVGNLYFVAPMSDMRLRGPYFSIASDSAPECFRAVIPFFSSFFRLVSQTVSAASLLPQLYLRGILELAAFFAIHSRTPAFGELHMQLFVPRIIAHADPNNHTLSHLAHARFPNRFVRQGQGVV